MAPRLGTKICGHWAAPIPAVEESLFDLHVDSREGRPSPESLERIRSAGGLIVHEYHVAQVRARLPIAAVPSLPFDLFQVPAGAPLTVDLVMGFDPPFSADDRDFLESLGATILQANDHKNISIVRAMVEDAVIPQIRSRDTVQNLGRNGYVCVD